MLCLKTLGGLRLERDGQALSPPAPRRQLLALLALMAGHDRPGISRDKLLAFIWPDSDTRHARNSLKQALYSVRRTLGDPLVKREGGRLRLNRGLIDCDLWYFEAALDGGDEAGAVALYQGPFLDGVYESDLEEFERWIDVERSRLARRYADALRALAERAEAEEEYEIAVNWWRRLSDAEPLCSTAALGLMRALAASGDSTSAREHARIHAAYVRAELGGPVSRAVVEFANQLRTYVGARESSTPVLVAEAPVARRLTPRGPDRRSGPVKAPTAFEIQPPRPVAPRLLSRRVLWMAAGLWAVSLLLPIRARLRGS
jgi:DNA-binding SARP family transcriptional activator